MSKKRVSYVRMGNVISLVMAGKHLMRSTNVEAIEEAAKEYEEDPSDRNWLKLNEAIDPISGITEIGDIVERNGKFFFEGSSIPLPNLMAHKILEYHKEGLDTGPLKAFWHLSMLNPDPVAREDFYNYCEKFGITITDFGYALLYKSVTHKTDDNEAPDINQELQRYVAAAYLKVKKQKKSPKKYTVYKDHEGYGHTSSENVLEGTEVVGNLEELHEGIGDIEGTIYTDKYSATMDIRLGIPVKKEREDCNSNKRNSCASGLHVGAWEYVSEFKGARYGGTMGFGGRKETVLGVLVNPMNVVAVPDYDHSKMRVCEYLPIVVVEKDESDNWEKYDLPHFENKYFDYEAEDLKLKMQEIEEQYANETDALSAKEKAAAVRNRLVKIGHEGEAYDAFKELEKQIVIDDDEILVVEKPEEDSEEE